MHLYQKMFKKLIDVLALNWLYIIIRNSIKEILDYIEVFFQV